MSVFADSNWAGCLKTRKSTSGACLFNGNHLIRSYAKTQATIALFSGEAELYATVVAASEGLGMKAMAKDFGMSLDPYLNVDASAAIGIMQRKGLGKLRHLDTQSLWTQDAVRQRRVIVEKVKGTENPADLMTEHLDGPSMSDMLKRCGIQSRDGRAAIAPEVVKLEEVQALNEARGHLSVSWADDSEHLGRR